MADPKTPAGTSRSIRVAQGSALERMTQGKRFTDAVHRMADLFEKAMAENWGPTTEVYVVDLSAEPVVRAPMATNIEWEPPASREPNDILADLPFAKGPEGQSYTYTGRTPLPTNDRLYRVWEPDRGEYVMMTEREALAMAALQYPAGLVPVLDSATFDGEVTGAETVPTDVDDLDHLA